MGMLLDEGDQEKYMIFLIQCTVHGDVFYFYSFFQFQNNIWL